MPRPGRRPKKTAPGGGISTIVKGRRPYLGDKIRKEKGWCNDQVWAEDRRLAVEGRAAQGGHRARRGVPQDPPGQFRRDGEGTGPDRRQVRHPACPLRRELREPQPPPPDGGRSDAKRRDLYRALPGTRQRLSCAAGASLP